MCSEPIFDLFCTACSGDRLAEVIRLQRDHDIDIHGHLDLPLKTAVNYGAGTVTRWLLESFTGYPSRLLGEMILPCLCVRGQLDLCRVLTLYHPVQPGINTLSLMIKEAIVRDQIDVALWLLKTYIPPRELCQDWILPQVCRVYNPSIIAQIARLYPDLDPDHRPPGWRESPREMVPLHSAGEMILDGLQPPGIMTRLSRLWREWRDR